ncbi:MAG: hypothetical protein OXC68_11400 [Aestuariivita sp.]|nr:hypothetical protein [Aestuariivita sp.]
MKNFQRTGAISNAHVGRDFERRACNILEAHGISLKENYQVPCGLANNKKKLHKFDLGSEDPPTLVECKSHTWRGGDKVPSAKIKNWAEAMFYFHMAPPEYRKIFLVEQSLRTSTGESLLAYFSRTCSHIIPQDVEFWELPRNSETVVIF